MMEIMPILMKFMPLMVFFFYIFAIMGMEIFYNSYGTLGSPLYNSYQQFQSFRTFIQSQYLLVQILAKSAWSHVAYDHCFRNPDYFTPVMIFFTGTQITLVYIVSTIIKGVFWEIYFTVDSIFVERERQIAIEEEAKEEKRKTIAEMSEISSSIENNIYFEANTVLKRKVINYKLNH
jgi:hypothetical protein